MTSASSLAFPGSRTLAGWWRQLASFRPQAFGVGYLFLHRIECAVSLVKAQKLEPLARLVLQALDLEQNATPQPDLLTRLEARLHLDRQVVGQVLHTLHNEGLVSAASDGCRLAERGRDVLHLGEYPAKVSERRVFAFLERCDAAGARTHPLHFLHVDSVNATPWQPGASYPFDVALLQQAFSQAEPWKRLFGFPLEVQALQPPAVNETTADASTWQRVIVDRPERMLVVLVVVPGSNDNRRLLGFSARQDGWVLQAARPVLSLDKDWEELFPGLVDIPADMLARAWQAWAGSRGPLGDGFESCTLSLVDHQLRVLAPAAAVDTLRQSRSDLFKGESWLLLGDGRIRLAAQLEISGT